MPPKSSARPSIKLGIEYLPVDQLHLDPENARLHKPAQIKQIARSIEAFGRGEDADLTSQHPTPKPVAMRSTARSCPGAP